MKVAQELIKALYAIRNAINGDGGGNNQQGDLSWYDVLSIIYPVAPIAITEYEYTNNPSLIYLKDISIKDELPIKSEGQSYDGTFLYDVPGLGDYSDSQGDSLKKIDLYKYDSFQDYDNNVVQGLRFLSAGPVQYSKTINGITFYIYQSD